mgnify:CR=1 FL=1
MRALLSTATGGPETLVLGELPEPAASPGSVVVAVKACSINFPDTLMIVDLYQFKPARPFAPGGEIAGIVEAVGDGVPHEQLGAGGDELAPEAEGELHAGVGGGPSAQRGTGDDP